MNYSRGGLLNISTLYKKWERANEKHLSECAGRYVALTLSAGKDSSACLHLLNRARQEFGFTVGAFLYAYPKHRYHPDEVGNIYDFWESKVDTMVIREADEDDDLLEEAACSGRDPCRPCQDLRKRALPEIFARTNRPVAETVIASGHSLWDLAGYALHQFASTQLSSNDAGSDRSDSERFLEISQRFYAFLKMPEGYSIYRPMLFLNANEIEAICAENSLPLLSTPCRYSKRRPKKVLGGYFERFGYQFTYEGVFEFAQKFIDIPERSEFERITQDEYLTKRF